MEFFIWMWLLFMCEVYDKIVYVNGKIDILNWYKYIVYIVYLLLRIRWKLMVRVLLGYVNSFNNFIRFEIWLFKINFGYFNCLIMILVMIKILDSKLFKVIVDNFRGGGGVIIENLSFLCV